jgi:moderate conductance mechanosensitive channel
VDLNDVLRWVIAHGLALLVGGAALLLIYRLARPAIHRVVPSVLRAQTAHLPSSSIATEEMSKRAVTIEDLLDGLLRVAVLAGMVALVLAVFDLWSILAGIVLILAAVLLASKEVVLDYVMGFLILVEGPYFKGDWISVGGQPGITEGEVQEVGLRRTVLRDALGSSHAVSNGLIRMSSNLTRVFSVAVVEVQVLRAADLDRAIAAAGRVVSELRDDPAWSDRLPADVATDIWVTGLGLDGASLRLQQRVSPGTQGPVSSEIRRRLVAAFQEASIGTARWDTPLRIVTEPGSAPADAGVDPSVGPRAGKPSAGTTRRPRRARAKGPE